MKKITAKVDRDKIFKSYINTDISPDSELVQNRTLIYLSRIFKLENISLYRELQKINPIAIGISDYLYTENHLVNNLLFILVKSDTQVHEIVKHRLCVDNYIFDNIANAKIRALVFRFDSVYNRCFDNFYQSKYSQMFTDEQLDTMYNTKSDKTSIAYKNMKNHIVTRQQHLKDIINTLDADITIDDLTESDYPLCLKSEIFNFTE